MNPQSNQQRRQWNWRARWLPAGVIALVLIGAGALTFALSRPSGSTVASRSVSPAAGADTTSSVSTGSGLTPGATKPPRALTKAPAVTHKPRPARMVKPKPKPKPVRVSQLNIAAAVSAARAEQAAGDRIGFAIVTADGQRLGSFNASSSNYSGSITKSMLLVAYLHQTGAGALNPVARSELTRMIEVSDNQAADWVYAHLSSANDAVQAVANSAGMTGFHIDTSDPVYVLGQSFVTAGDFAKFFAVIEHMMPSAQQSFGMYLLAHVEQRVGLLASGLPGVIYAKEGWKPENDGLLGSPYIVNQAAQFTDDGTTYGVAVTVGAVSDQSAGEAVVRHIVSALM